MTLYNRIFLLLFLGLAACSQNGGNRFINATDIEKGLYSLAGEEHKVHFEALYRSPARRLNELRTDSLEFKIKETTQFLFGPLTYRKLGGIQKGENITPHVDQAYVEDERVIVPYTYEATWMIQHSALGQDSLRLPLPFSVPDLKTDQWQNCTDPAEDHRTWSFFWYFWEPERRGCDHQLNAQYQEIEVMIDAATPQTKISFPEYSRMIHNKDGVPTLSMTFAFGYVEDKSNPNPFKDHDFGMSEFQHFYRDTKTQLLALEFVETAVRQSDITRGSTIIGSKFVGNKQGVRIEVSILAAAGVDQMDLFAYSYARNHEGFFGWYGHSRVGSGFDAQVFEYKLKAGSNLYFLTNDYQLIYWAGCNSYSYYTLPFFELKSKINPELDPQGTRNLDLISNVLPSLFAFNAYNAQVLFQAILNWNTPTSYQSIVKQIEGFANSSDSQVMVNVLGDEDNPQ